MKINLLNSDLPLEYSHGGDRHAKLSSLLILGSRLKESSILCVCVVQRSMNANLV